MFRFQVQGVVGEGAFATVYRAKNRATGELFAIKEYRERASNWKEVCKNAEIETLLQLRGHPNILKLLEVGRESDGRVFFVTALEQGTLLNIIQTKGALDESTAGAVLRQVMTGLNVMHGMRYIHRDVKPENILVSFEETPEQLQMLPKVTLADFGSTAHFDAIHGADYVTTRYYRSPEMVFKLPTYGPEVDVWAVGCICFEVLTGKPLFPAKGESDLLLRMCAVLGSPPLSDPRFAAYQQCSPSIVPPSGFTRQPIARWFVSTDLRTHPSQKAMDLLGKILTWHASDRIDCATALRTSAFLQQQ